MATGGTKGPRGGRRGARWARALGASLAVHGIVLAALLLAPGEAATPEGVSRVPLRVIGKAAREVPGPVPAPVAKALPGEAVAAEAPSRPSKAAADRRRAPDAAPPEAPAVVTPAAQAAPALAAKPGMAPGPGTHGATAPGPGDGPGTGGGSGPGNGSGDPAAAPGEGVGGTGGRGPEGGPAAGAGPVDERVRYALGVRRRLEDASRYPGGARRAGRDGRVVLRLRVDPDGRVADTAVQTPSEWPDLDRAALAAAGRLDGLPPPPGGAMDVVVPVVFRFRSP